MHPACARSASSTTGNSTDSPEEADAILAEISDLLGARVDRRARHACRWRRNDVLVVAPYNAQVVTLRAEL